MKKYRSIFSLMGLAALLLACGGETSTSSTGGVDVDLEDAIAQAESRRVADPNEMGANKCLLGYATKYDELLSKESVLSITGFSEEVLEEKYSKAIDDPSFHTFSYRFANKRNGVVPGTDYKMEIKDEIMIKSIKPMSLKQFQQNYKVPTQEEIDLSNQTIDDVVEGKSESEEANEKIADLEEKGVSKETTKGVTDIMKNAFSNVAKSYRNVDGLGDAATWNTFTNSLNVLQNGVQFELVVNVSADNEASQAVAVSLAKQILEKCR